ncbi:MFS transporter [Clostridium tagluense]|uniref:MFS transporter n=1 Tax=Clostridium tagluense TaxID=360422 RepID=UPI001CF50FE9|nr:MFS transporter [Clostridium tagluense]MCB2313642.1 MFS transporter [Clostridium tagluense]MCB2318110.1 MFS transporter [Clostridium tagluense]MCB2323954.1 MFS transporter [Clostridium tagluense]MCB2327894.1 MFS transporter [Clostridium tagluense]MCB2333046.1 MFS transporter [Clostridium tagluense]
MRKNFLWIIVGIVLMNGIGMTMVFPLLPFLLGNYLPASQIVVGMSALASVFAACTFFAAPIFGALSDRYGRKKILIISLLGSVIGYILFGIGGALWVLFLGRIIDGLTAGNISTLFAYIADSTEPQERTKWFSYIGAAMGIGCMIGPALGGPLGAISITLPFFVTAGIMFLSTICTYFFLPESLSPEKRSTHFSIKSFNIFSQFKDIFTMKEARSLIIVGGFFYVGLGIYQFNFSIFLKDIFSWGPALIGGIFTIIGACDIISRAVLLPLLLKKFSERNIGIVGLFGLALGLSLIILSVHITSPVFIIAAVMSITLGEGLFDPSYNGRLSKSVDENSQGKLQGVNQSLQSAYRVLVPLAAAAIYSFSPGILYGVATCVMIGSLILFSKLQPQYT